MTVGSSDASSDSAASRAGTAASVLSDLVGVEEAEEAQQSSLSRVNAGKVGQQFEEFLADKGVSDGLKEHARRTGAGSPPLKQDGTVQPWPFGGPYPPAVAAFAIKYHRTGTGNMGYALKAVSSVQTVEGQLRAEAYRQCSWPSESNKRDWGKRNLGQVNLQKSTAATRKIRLDYGLEVQEARSVKRMLFSSDVDWLHSVLQKHTENVNKAMLADALLAMVALTTKRMSSFTRNDQRTRGLAEYTAGQVAKGRKVNVHDVESAIINDLQVNGWIDSTGRRRIEISFRYGHWKGLEFGTTKIRYASMSPAPSDIPIEADNACVLFRWLWKRCVFKHQRLARDAGKSEEQQFAAVFGSDAQLAAYVGCPTGKSATPLFRLEFAESQLRLPVFSVVTATGFITTHAMNTAQTVILFVWVFETLCHLPPYCYSLYSLRKAMLDTLQRQGQAALAARAADHQHGSKVSSRNYSSFGEHLDSGSLQRGREERHTFIQKKSAMFLAMSPETLPSLDSEKVTAALHKSPTYQKYLVELKDQRPVLFKIRVKQLRKTTWRIVKKDSFKRREKQLENCTPMFEAHGFREFQDPDQPDPSKWLRQYAVPKPSLLTLKDFALSAVMEVTEGKQIVNVANVLESITFDLNAMKVAMKVETSVSVVLPTREQATMLVSGYTETYNYVATTVGPRKHSSVSRYYACTRGCLCMEYPNVPGRTTPKAWNGKFGKYFVFGLMRGKPWLLAWYHEQHVHNERGLFLCSDCNVYFSTSSHVCAPPPAEQSDDESGSASESDEEEDNFETMLTQEVDSSLDSSEDEVMEEVEETTVTAVATPLPRRSSGTADTPGTHSSSSRKRVARVVSGTELNGTLRGKSIRRKLIPEKCMRGESSSFFKTRDFTEHTSWGWGKAKDK